MPMHPIFPPCTFLLLLYQFVTPVFSLVTLATMRNLTQLFDGERMGIDHGPGRGVPLWPAALMKQSVIVMEIDTNARCGLLESQFSAALERLATTLEMELNKPLQEHSSTSTFSSKYHAESLGSACITIREEFHAFLAAVVRFLYSVQEAEMRCYWGGRREGRRGREWESRLRPDLRGGAGPDELHVKLEENVEKKKGVFMCLNWLQGLWASPHMNIRNRSFIEQQMDLYKGTGCFHGSDRDTEVLRRGVEVVEYLNDLMDSFP